MQVLNLPCDALALCCFFPPIPDPSGAGPWAGRGPFLSMHLPYHTTLAHQRKGFLALKLACRHACWQA